MDPADPPPIPPWLASLRRATTVLARRDLAERISISAEALGRYKLRTALSVLGVVLGVAAVIAMMSVSDGARQEALQQVEQLGLNNIIVRNRGLSAAQGSGLVLRDAETLRALVPQLVSVAPLIERYPVVFGPLESRMARVLGITAEYRDVLDLEVSRGRFLGRFDDRSQARVCVVGSSLVRGLFGYRDPIGESVRIGSEWYRVVGVLADRSADARAVGTVAPRDLNNAVLVSISGLLGRSVTLNPEQRVNEIWIRLEEGGRVSEVGQVVDHTLSRLHGDLADHEVVIPRELLNQRIRTQRTFAVVVGSVAVLSLLVGGIGIMNIMLASVLERTREIGIRRTAGATRRDITLQFLTESLLMTLSGGAIGIVAGIIVSYAITAYAEWSTRISVLSVFLAFFVSFVVGLVFGIYPAAKAARLQPIDAVRYE